MNAFEKYKKRLGVSNRPTTNSIVNASIDRHERQFDTSPSFYVSKINGEPVDTIVNTTRYHRDIKQIHFRSNFSPKIGDLIEYKDEFYLLTKVDKNEVYQYGQMERCNYLLDVQLEDGEEIFVGYDEFDRPIYEEEVKLVKEPCIVKDRYYSVNDNDSLPLTEGKLIISLQYKDYKNLVLNEDITMYGKTFKISDTSIIDVENGTGIIHIHTERRDNNYE